MDQNDLLQLRLHNQALIDSSFHSPTEVVGWMLAMQGQDFSGAKWSVGIRLPGSTETDVERAFECRSIVRTWLMRGTLHLVLAEDILWLLTLVGPKVIAGNRRRYGELEFDDRTLRQSNALIVKALQKEKSLTRRELLAMLREKGISTEGQRGIYMLQRASLDRLICQGRVQANNPTFILLETFPHRNLSREEALAEMSRRYVTSRGPTTVQDFTWWSGLSATEARAGLESIRSELKAESIDGQTYYWSEAFSTPTRTQSTFLLPTFDEFLLAYKDRSATLGERSLVQLAPMGGMIPGTVALDGKVKGIWKRTFKKEDVLISIFPYESFTPAELRQVKTAAQEFGQFLGRKVVLV